MIEFPHPLRLAIGSHRPGTGAGCAMNVISYQNGDREITDYPSCSAPPLARLVQKANDMICNHTEPTHDHPRLLCPPCSQIVLDLGHATVGTGESDQWTLQRWLRSLLVDSKWGVAQYVRAGDIPLVMHVADLLAAGRDVSGSHWMAARNDMAQASRIAGWHGGLSECQAYAYDAAGYSANLATGVATALPFHDVTREANSAADAAGTANSVAALDGFSVGMWIEFTRWAIDEWHRVAGTTPHTPDPAAVSGALERMYATPVA